MPNFCLGLVARNPSWQRSCATASTDRTYDRNRFDAPSPSSCKPGAVHIWVPAFAGTTAERQAGDKYCCHSREGGHPVDAGICYLIDGSAITVGVDGPHGIAVPE